MTIREKRDTPGIKLTQSDWGETGSQGTHGGGGGQKHNKTVQDPDISPPSWKVRPRTVETSKGEGQVGTREVAQEEDRHPGGGRQTETREATKEGGAREETGGTRSRRRTAGPRPQP